ncbi:AsnC family transcriptional regulator [Candidatus Woesearchaeota archaeon]|nr:AsnC family transcriptional regulator [Candidatus Woesearchaeota archaeon]
MDKLDLKIMVELMRNSRVPVTVLATKVKASREVVTYRMNKLEHDGIILAYVAEINPQHLGFVGAALFLNLRAQGEKAFKQYLLASPSFSWVAELSGTWNFGMSVFGRTNEEVDAKVKELLTRFKADIIDHRFTLHRSNRFFYEKYFGKMPATSQTLVNPHKLDAIDRIILQAMSLHARISCVDLAQQVTLSAVAVAHRIKDLETCGLLGKYSFFVDVQKLGLFQYSIFIQNKNVDVRNKLLSYLSQHPSVSFISEYVSDPFLEFGLFVKDPYQVRGILQEIEQSFPDNRILEILLFQKEFISIGPPKCVFE